jgi:hypothetical protein
LKKNISIPLPGLQVGIKDKQECQCQGHGEREGVMTFYETIKVDSKNLSFFKKGFLKKVDTLLPDMLCGERWLKDQILLIFVI